MKKKAFLFLIHAVFLFNSCQKEVPTTEITSENLTPERKSVVEDCKKWFNEKYNSPKKLAAMKSGDAGTSSDDVGQPDWNQASFLELSPRISEFARFPLKGATVNCSYTAKMNPKGFRDLLLRKKGDADFYSDILEIHPDESYLKEKLKEKDLPEGTDMRKLIDNDDFTGYFLVYAMDNSLRFGERREKGAVTTRLSIPNQK